MVMYSVISGNHQISFEADVFYITDYVLYCTAEYVIIFSLCASDRPERLF